MPRNRKTKQRSPLIVQPMVGPGFTGLNTELSHAQNISEEAWASILDNVVFDDLARPSLRKGYTDVTTGTAAGALESVYHLHEYVRNDGTTSLIAANTAFRIWESTDNGVNWTDISGNLDPSTGGSPLASLDLQFVNFNDDLYVGAKGHKVHRFNTTLGSFTEITDSGVSGGAILAAFGRIWNVIDSGSVIEYCGLLDGTDWTSAASGSIDASNAWTKGTDTPTAIAAFGATLVVFGEQHILLYVDGAGSELGVDPDNLYVVDTIEGTGTTNRDSIVNIGEGDLWFLGPSGIQSLARVVEDKVNPLVDISVNQRSLVASLLQGHTGEPASVKAVFNAKEKFALFLFPAQSRVVCYDMRFPLDNGAWRCTTWTTDVAYTGAVVRRNRDMLFSGPAGNALKYEGYLDDKGGTNTAITMQFATPWINVGQGEHARLKILKSFYMYIYGEGTLSGTARWGFDYRPLEHSLAWSNVYVCSGGEWGSGEWGDAEFSEGLRLRRQDLAASHQGHFFKFYTTIVSSIESKLALQEVGSRIKLGRIV